MKHFNTTVVFTENDYEFWSTTFMKKLLSLILTFSVCFALHALTPEEVLEISRTQTSIDTMASEAQVSVQRPVGTTIEMLSLREYTGYDASNQQANMIVFNAPAKYKNTRFLMVTRKDGSMDQRVYLPSMGKSRRVTAETEGSGSFFGTDFSYSDIAFLSRAVALDTHTFLDEEEYNGKECYVIQSIPKTAEGYAKCINKISKADNMLQTAEFYDKTGKLVKRLEFLDYKDVSGVLTPFTVKMTTLATNTATVISIKKIEYGLKIPTAVFTTRYLETGR